MPDNQPPLLPCPFCGDIKSLDAAEALGQHIDGCPTIAAGCENCGAIGPEVSYTGGKQVPIPTPPELLARSAERWNTRASPVTRSAKDWTEILYFGEATSLLQYDPEDSFTQQFRGTSELIQRIIEETRVEASQPAKLVGSFGDDSPAYAEPKPQSDEGLREALTELVGHVETLTNESRGVDGWHLNGNLAEWGEFDWLFDAIAKAKAALSRQAPVVMQTAVDWAEEIGRTANSFCKASGSRYYDPLKAAGIIQQAIDHGRWELRHAPNVTSSRWAAQVVRCLKQMFPNWEKGYDWTNGSYENSQFSFSQQRANEAIDAIRKYEDYLIKGDFGFVADRSAMRSTAFEEGRKSALADGKLREALEKMLTCRLRRDVAKPHGWSITSLNKEADSAQQVLDTLAQPASGGGE